MQRPNRSLVIAFIVFAISFPYSSYAMEDIEEKVDKLEKDTARVETESDAAKKLLESTDRITKETNLEEITDFVSEYKKRSDEWNRKYEGIQTGGGSSEKVSGQDISKLVTIEEKPELEKKQPARIPEKERWQREKEEDEEAAERRRIEKERRLEEERRRSEERQMREKEEEAEREEKELRREVEERRLEAERRRREEEKESAIEKRDVETVIEEEVIIKRKMRVPRGVKIPNIGKTFEKTDLTAGLPIPKSVKEEIEKKEKELKRREEELEKQKRALEVERPEVTPTFVPPTSLLPFEEIPERRQPLEAIPTTVPYQEPLREEPSITPSQPFQQLAPEVRPAPGVTSTVPTGAPPTSKDTKVEELEREWRILMYGEDGERHYQRLLQEQQQSTTPQTSPTPQGRTPAPRSSYYGSQNKTALPKRLYVMRSEYGRGYEEGGYGRETSYRDPDYGSYSKRLTPKKIQKELEEYADKQSPKVATLITHLLRIGKKIKKGSAYESFTIKFIDAVLTLPMFFRILTDSTGKPIKIAGKKTLADIKVIDLIEKNVKGKTGYDPETGKQFEIVKHPPAEIQDLPSSIVKGYRDLLLLITKNPIKKFLKKSEAIETSIEYLLRDYDPDFERDFKRAIKGLHLGFLGKRPKRTGTATLRIIINKLNKLFERYEKMGFLLRKEKIKEKHAKKWVNTLKTIYNNLIEDPVDDVTKLFAALVKKSMKKGTFL